MSNLLALLYGRPDRAPTVKSEEQYQRERDQEKQGVVSFEMLPRAAAARQAIGDYLSDTLIRPEATRQLTDEQIRDQERGGRYDNQEIGRMMRDFTINDRIAVEIEMQERQPSLYASDYDPLRI